MRSPEQGKTRGRDRLLVGLVIGLALGALIGAWVASALDDTEASAAGAAVPAACVGAIEAARSRLVLNAEAMDLVRAYRELFGRVVDAIDNLDADAVPALLDEAEELNEAGRGLVEDATETNFSKPAQRCEGLARSATV